MEKIKFGTSFIFEKDLSSFEFDASLVGALNHSHLYTRKDKKWVLIKKAGEFFTKSDLNLLEISNLKEFNLINKNQEQLFNQYFEEIKNAKDSSSVKNIFDLFLKTIVNDIFLNSSESIFTLMYTCYRNLYQLPAEVLSDKLTPNVASRSFMSSTINFYNAILLGITDFKFLEDLYNVSYLMDLTVKKEIISLTERLREGNRKGISKEEEEDFIYTIEESFDLAQNYEENFNYRNTLELIKIHHEQIDGNGVPLGANYKSLTLVQNAIIFTENIISFELPEFGAEDANYILMSNIAKYHSRSNLNNQIILYWHSLLREYFKPISSVQIEESA